ncbi:LacI family DNA-binding transcriptional regulator [Mesorhizobium sp. ESP7-2]|uniref:LacI family DNA-binding transcriptional regulator n=1 Tax=Mesorhizobium sp. ESP7-2 TaxID=2876622 RepID=UPI001CCC8598|nr:LacI family DNA-binding transcriptional regulator [Mesorhizobium sp. ESP7-2]MBZ9708862.1 LacI family DNA-binding transcriptional regulator [Mesorhizobium sp. ESP7-2]
MSKTGSGRRDRYDGGNVERAKEGSSRPVTMATVGRLAGVSQVTVSRALSDPSKVSPATFEKIRNAIEMTGFVPNAIAGALASRRSRLIGALVPSITNIVYSSMIQAFSEGIAGHGYQILLSETGFDPKEEERAIVTLLSRRPDAMLLTGIHHMLEARRMLMAAGIPVVELWDMTETPIDLCVGFSHVETGRAVAEFVLEAGYKNAATVSAGDERALRRKDAFVKEIGRRAGIDVTQINFVGGASLARGREALRILVDEQNFRGGAIFCSSDLLAHGVLIEANVRGLRVPDEIAVIGFGDQDFAAHVVPPLTTVRVDRTELGLTAAKAILARFDGEPPAGRVKDLGFQIIARQSA